METKEIKKGDYIRGFKFEFGFVNSMYKHIGEIGKVVLIKDDYIDIMFGDDIWSYPKQQAIEHLVDPLEQTPFYKPDFSHLREKIEKGVDIRFESKSVEDLKLDSLKREMETKDNINPSHYKRLPKETIERIGDNLSLCEFKGYLKGNILKYLDRYENKNGVEDLRKMQWYLNKLIEIENGKA